MYHWYVERQVRTVFAQLSAGDWEPSIAAMPPELRHVFPGDHALGGERRTREGMRRWFTRLYTIFPDLRFEVEAVLVRGWPWDTTVAVQWTDRATPPDGIPYTNVGMHLLRLRRGRLVSLQVYLDTQKVAEVCDRLAAGGMTEAAAPPIDETWLASDANGHPG